MTPQDTQEPTVEQCLTELRQIFPEHEHIRVRIGCSWFGGDQVDVLARIVVGQYEWFGKSLSEAMGHAREWNKTHARRFFCSCGGALTAEEYADHQKRGHN